MQLLRAYKNKSWMLYMLQGKYIKFDKNFFFTIEALSDLASLSSLPSDTLFLAIFPIEKLIYGWDVREILTTKNICLKPLFSFYTGWHRSLWHLTSTPCDKNIKIGEKMYYNTRSRSLSPCWQSTDHFLNLSPSFKFLEHMPCLFYVTAQFPIMRFPI